MWELAERIRYQPIDCKWPSKSEAKTSLVFQAIEIGSVTLEQKTWVPAMAPWRSNLDGQVTEDVIQWYEHYATGQPGAIVIEATGIRDVSSGPLLRISHDRYIQGLTELVKRVKAASDNKTKVLIQIIDFLAIKRRPNRELFLTRFLELKERHISKLKAEKLNEEEVRQHLITLSDKQLKHILDDKEYAQLTHGYREYVTDINLPHIADLPSVLPDLFASAAARADQAGLDGIELHYAHAYTMASFLSAKNDRTDDYGGSREERIKLPLEVFNKVRNAVSSSAAVGCRFLSDECIDSGSDLDDSCFYAVEFAKAGMDFLSLSSGGKFDDSKQSKVDAAAYPYTGPSGYECMPDHISDGFGPFGRNIEPTNAVRAFVRAAGYDTPINYCEGLDQKHKQVTCQL